MSSTPTEAGVRTDKTSELVAEVGLEHEDLVLSPSTAAVDSLIVHPMARSGDTMFISAEPDDVPAVDRALHQDPTVTAVTAFSASRYRIEPATGVIDPLSILTACDGWIASESVRSGAWRLRVHFPARSALVRFNRACRERNISVTLRHLHRGDPERTVVGLTAKQRALLECATARGYFDVPRSTSQKALAEDIGISKSAVSQRLRRAIAALCASTLE